MKVGLLIITHGNVGSSMLDTAISVLGTCPLKTQALGIAMSGEPEEQLEEARRYTKRLDQGNGVLILTDLYGSTPSNIACKLRGDKVAVVAGLNLPMLLRVLNYPELELEDLVQKALTGGRDGVLSCRDLQP
ncbi:MAG: PTS sugar transporter subunit IIA [Proteobacteria bacterium]|jgi:mannose PTS system EIIA component|nr:PTS sugar transporter subunit IIA [Pseudomonadota bacterium]MCG6936257.1 PTS sugar transporter subunit IIA [Pseudomonadota bacterium]